MLDQIMDFVETETGFNHAERDYLALVRNAKKLLVKAHEKEIYALGGDAIAARIHRDNGGVYPFSRLDFLSHKLQELAYPALVPKVYAADFTDAQRPVFVIERIDLDERHKAYNVWHQQAHQREGLDFRYDAEFLSVKDAEAIEAMAQEHMRMVDEMKREYAGLLEEKGIAFDYSYVNIAWRGGQPIALELHKCQRDYLFNFDACYRYFSQRHGGAEERGDALRILERIGELQQA